MKAGDPYLIRRMEEYIDYLEEAKVFTTLYCPYSYSQILLGDEGEDKTTFPEHAGL